MLIYNRHNFSVPKERFHRGIIQAVSFTRHGLKHSHLTDARLISRMRIIKSLIGMDHGFRVYIHLKSFREFNRCMRDEFHMEACRDMMCHNFPCSDILHTREINSFARSYTETGGVFDEYLTRLLLIEPI